MTTKLKTIDITSIDMDLNENVRLPELMNLTKLKVDIAAAGGLHQPLVVEDIGDGRFHLIAGFRRLSSILQINEGLEAEVNEDVKELIQKDNHPFNPIMSVQALVHESLDDQTRESIRCDHMTVKGLSSFEQYLAAKKLLMTGLSEEKVGARLGQSRGWAQERRMLARLAAVEPWIEEQFRLKAIGKENKSPSMAEVRALNTIHQKGTEQEFDEAVSKLKEGKAPAPKPKVRSMTDLKKAEELSNNPAVKAALRFAMGEEVSLADYQISTETAG